MHSLKYAALYLFVIQFFQRADVKMHLQLHTIAQYWNRLY